MAATRILIARTFAAASLAAALGLVPAMAQTRDFIIVPGERVGPVSLGMSEMVLLSVVGPPDGMLKQGTDTLYSWGTLTARIGEKSAVVDEITLNDPRYQTDGRVHVGSAELAVIAILGEPMKRTTTSATTTLQFAGIEIVERNNAVMLIRVHK